MCAGMNEVRNTERDGAGSGEYDHVTRHVITLLTARYRVSL